MQLVGHLIYLVWMLNSSTFTKKSDSNEQFEFSNWVAFNQLGFKIKGITDCRHSKPTSGVSDVWQILWNVIYAFVSWWLIVNYPN